jgi:hypothetical protein
VTQGIQDLQNRMPLVEKRWTALRLYGRVDGGPPSIANVRGALGAWRGNQFLGVVYPENDPIPLKEDGGERINLDDSLYFYIPTSWRVGTIKFKGVIYQGSPGNMDFEPDDQNNYAEATVTFQKVDPLYIRLVPEHVHEDYDTTKTETTFYYFGNESTVGSVMLDAFRYIPIAELYFDPSMNFPITIPEIFNTGGPSVYNGPVLPANHALGNEWDFRPTADKTFGDWPDANAAMSILRLWSSAPVNSWFWYGMVDSAMATGNWTGLATNGVASGKFGTTFDTDSPWDMKYGSTLVHELGHKVMPGPDHINCKGNEETGGGLDDGYPYQAPNCSMAAVDPEGFYGFDIYWSLWPGILGGPTVVSNDPAAAEPNRGFPYMGYKGPKWADPYDYCKSLIGEGIACDTSMVYLPAGPVRLVSNDSQATHLHSNVGAGIASAPALVGQAPGRFALISGQVESDGSNAEIERFVSTESAPADPVDQSRRRLAEMAAAGTGPVLAFLDSSDREIASYPMANLDESPHTDAGSSFTTIEFAEWFPVPADARSVELRASGRTLTRLSASAGAPQVTLLSPNGGTIAKPLTIEWAASDPDGDSLTYTLLYSADQGTVWQPIATDLQSTKMTLGELGPISGSTRGLFKVIASDGFQSAEDVSDTPVTVPDRAPIATILTPGTGGTFAQGTTLVFTGSAFDMEERGLPPAALRWQSSLDGDLGEGAEVLTRTLSPGRHTITLRARDGVGNEGIATTEVVIEASTRVLPTGTVERDLIARLGGTSEGTSESAAWWIAGGGAAGVVAGIVLAAAWTRRKHARQSRAV